MIDQTRAWRPSQIRRGWRRKLYERALAIELPRRMAWFATDRGIVRYEIPEPAGDRFERARLRYRGALVGALRAHVAPGLYYAEDEPGVLRGLSTVEFTRRFYEDRTVALDYVGRLEVSTVWLGINHQYGDGPPLIYETMIFCRGDKGDDMYQERYTYRAQALEGHARAMVLAASLEASLPRPS